jgi:hypothetical protein
VCGEVEVVGGRENEEMVQVGRGTFVPSVRVLVVTVVVECVNLVES